MRNYYNDNSPFCCEWLRNLIAAGLIPPGDVDPRSIKEVTADDLQGYDQCHFFAGVAGWPEAFRLAGIAGVKGIWTGSPPCQDNSVAQSIHGSRQGLRGVRSGLAHDWLALVGSVRPRCVLFENVPGIKQWQTEITGSLAGFGYGVDVRDLPASRSGAPHPRRRVWIAADRDGARLAIAGQAGPSTVASEPWPAPPRDVWAQNHPATGSLADGLSARMAAIHALGNAVCPQSAAQFIRAYLAH